jgi:hypothetical protein
MAITKADYAAGCATGCGLFLNGCGDEILSRSLKARHLLQTAMKPRAGLALYLTECELRRASIKEKCGA